MKLNIYRFLAGIIIILVFSILPGDGCAHDQGMAADFIRIFDLDGDGLVSADEFPGGQDHFDRLDTDGDGYLDAAEAPQGPPRPPSAAELVAELDSDGDGRLSWEEFQGPADHFDDLDMDEDGFLSVEELEAGKPGPPKDIGLESKDIDQDGLISQAEFKGPLHLFNRLDADGDGYISPDEARPRHFQKHVDRSAE